MKPLVGFSSLCLACCALLAADSHARACSPSDWWVSAQDLPDCARLSVVGSGQFELVNDCQEDLTLSSECSTCALPAVVLAGDVGLLELPAPTAPALVDVGWEGVADAGTVTFAFEVNRCPGPQGCSVTTLGVERASGWAPSFVVGAVLVLARVRRRRLRG